MSATTRSTANPFRALLHRIDRFFQEDFPPLLSRIQAFHDGEDWSEWQQWRVAFENELEALSSAFILAPNRAGFSVEEVERRVKGLCHHVREVLRWQEWYTSLSDAEKKETPAPQRIDACLRERYRRAQDAMKPVREFADLVEAAELPEQTQARATQERPTLLDDASAYRTVADEPVIDPPPEAIEASAYLSAQHLANVASLLHAAIGRLNGVPGPAPPFAWNAQLLPLAIDHPNAVPSPAPRPRTEFENDVAAALEVCRECCCPILDRLRNLHPDMVKGWDRWSACAVEAVQLYARRVLMQAAYLRGENVMEDIRHPQRFEDLPALFPGWASGMIEKEFALLRASSPGTAPNRFLTIGEADDSTELPTTWPTLLSAPDIAGRLGQPVDRVDSFLRRYRNSHRDCCVEVNNPRKNEASCLYRTADVLPGLRQQLLKWRLLTDG